MIKKYNFGFTLVELLAVIVIISIISLIALPVLLNVIKDSRKSSEKESVKLYLDTINNTIYKQNLKTKYEPDSCIIQSTGDLICQSEDEDIYLDENKENKILSIEMKGKKPSEGTLFFTNGKITTGENIKYNGLYYTVTNDEVLNGTKKKTDILMGTIARIQVSSQNYTGTCEIQDATTMVCGNETITLSQSEHKITEGVITFSNGEVISYKNLKMEGKYYHNKNGEKRETNEKQYLCTKISDSDNSNSITMGDKYTCKVNDNDTFYFYVLTNPSNNEINLIMDRNICNDGTVDYTSTNNYCKYKWSSSNNKSGPVIVMQELYKGTKNWDNVPIIELNYTDEANGTETDKGYTSIITNSGVATITGKPTTNVITIGTTLEPLRARLPKESEVKVAGCTGDNGSCPVWLMENMTYRNISNDKYSMNNNNEAYQNIGGYWLLPSSPGASDLVRDIYPQGMVNQLYPNHVVYGARPVITVSITDLSS